MNVSFLPEKASGAVSTDPANLPYYAARSLLRMFIALGLSVVFTFVYGTAAARLRRAEKVLIPLLDILQSVPVLGFLSITVTAFIALFPGSTLGLECAAIFAIFTSQAWNMTFSFYHSLITQPRDLDEAARLYRLTKWERFWRLDVPGSMIGLVWNGMMSFGGGWFFLAVSESISVLNRHYALPGIGSYVAAAIEEGSLTKVAIAIVTMVVLVIGVNVLFWRPLVAWSEKFRLEESEASDKPKSVVLDILRRSSVPKLFGRATRPMSRSLDHVTRPFGLAEHPLATEPSRRRAGDIAFAVIVGGASVWIGVEAFRYIGTNVGLGELVHAAGLGAITLSRVVVVVLFSTVLWVPIGAIIGMTPRLARYAQPIVQILAGFPAVLLFPFATVAFVHAGVPLNYGGILLMSLGAQWYILFNAIAGGTSIPNDLREMTTNLDLGRHERWRRLILPAVFPSYVTGGITAAGGAWNASIVAEVVAFGRHRLVATGLGAYIAAATAAGDFPRILTGVAVMSLYVVGLNRLVWRRLYRLAETRYAL
jgi:NitT/TauT family transport system permease protein